MRGTVLGNCREMAIRTYNFKRATIIDHRSGCVRPLRSLTDGDIQPFIDAMKVWAVEKSQPEQAAKPGEAK